MKKILFLALSATILLASCSKKSDPNAATNATMVTIDRTTYQTTVIGSLRWTNANYNGSGGVNYDNVTGNLVSAGKLYTLAEAQAVLLPPGWRLPTRADYNQLLKSVGASTDQDGDSVGDSTVTRKLVSGWTYANGNNATSFGASPFGYYNSAADSFIGKGDATAFWTSTPVPNNTMYYGFGIDNYLVNGQRPLTSYLDYWRPADRLSLRFVKDN